jgi:hypothetical protein
MEGVSTSTARRHSTASSEGTPDVHTAAAGIEPGRTRRTDRTHATLQALLPRFRRAARKLDSGVHHVVASQIADAWQTCRNNRPFARSRRNRSGLQVVKTAERTFVIAPAGPDIDTRENTTRRQFVVLERVKDDPKNGKARPSRFHPVCADLSVDKRVSFYRREDGTWSVLGGPPSGGTTTWLAPDDVDRFVSLRAGSGVTVVGNRELCAVTLHSGHATSAEKKQAVIARESTPDGNRYRVLDSDLQLGCDVAPFDGASAEQPFIHDLLGRVVKQYRWPDGETLSLARHVAVTAFRAGASVADAATLSEWILLAAHTDLGERAKSAYGQTAATAGNMLRHGIPLAQVSRSVRDLVRSAEWLHAGMPVPAPLPSTVAVTEATDTPTIVEAGGLSRDDALLAMHRTAIQGAQDATFGGFGVDVAHTRTTSRRDHGALMSALHAVARELYVEKVESAATLQAVAGRATDNALAALRNRAEALNTEAEGKEAEIAQTRMRRRETEAVAAHAAAARVTTHRPTTASTPEGGWLSRFLGWRTRRDATGPDVRDANATESTLDTAALDATLHAQEARATSLRARAQAVAARANLIETTMSPCIEAMISAILDAKAHAPADQIAALNAGTAAWQATAHGTDPAGAALSARTTHLACLSGADHDAAQTAGMYMAVLCRNGAVTTDAAGSDAAHAYRLTLAQAAMHGDRPWTREDGASAMLGALAALSTIQATEGAPKEDRLRIADMLKTRVPTVRDAETLPPAGVDRLLFRSVDPAPIKKPPLSTSTVSGIPMHYQAVPTRLDASTAEAVPGLNHAKIRTLTDSGFQSPSGIGATHYLIELAGPQGRQWVDFDWSANTNQLYGEVSIKPMRPPRAEGIDVASANDADDDVGGEAKVLVAYNGFSARWESMSQRTTDLKVRTDAAMREIDHLITSRDATLSWRNLSYAGAKSGYLENLLPHIKTRVEEEIRLFAQGRHSQPLFKDNVSKLFIDLAQSVERDRSRKKAITRHQLDTTIRLVTAVALGAGIGGARLGAMF